MACGSRSNDAVTDVRVAVTDVALRIARPEDAAGVLAIYAPIVQASAITFELEVPSEAAMQQRIAATLARWPWLIGERDGEVVGYAYATSHRERAAYQWCVEVSVYIQEHARRTGLAGRLYGALFPLLAKQGFVNAYAGITLPNAPSVALHEGLGFRKLGVYPRIGFKLGAWHDVGWWERLLQPLPAEPRAPVPFAELHARNPLRDA
jgi:L-amino acid N-acyltransferase YncA